MIVPTPRAELAYEQPVGAWWMKVYKKLIVGL